MSETRWKELGVIYKHSVSQSGYSRQKTLDLYSGSYQYLEMVCRNMSTKDSVSNCKEFNKIWAGIFQEVEEHN